jgi:L-malate glycosyltransferase
VLSNQRVLRNPTHPAAGPPPKLAKVSLMIGQLGLGGTEKQVVLLAQGLAERGIDTNVLLMFEGGPHESTLRKAGIPVTHLGFGQFRTAWNAPRNTAAFGRLVRHLRRERPNVLHAFLLHCYLLAAPAARMARVPVLVAGRRSLSISKEGHRFLLATERCANRATDLLIANAHAVAEDTLERERIPSQKVTVVYNGLPDSAFSEFAPARIETVLPVVLCVANLRTYKGHRHLLSAMAQLQAEGSPCTLVLAGEGDQRATLEHQAARLGIDVRLLGARVDVGQLLARADVVVLPSLQEGMSNAVMEAMAAGRPIVATDVGGIPELLLDRGILVPPGDPAALATGIGNLLSDRARAARLGAQARRWSRDHLHVNRMVDDHVRIYSDLLER